MYKNFKNLQLEANTKSQRYVPVLKLISSQHYIILPWLFAGRIDYKIARRWSSCVLSLLVNTFTGGTCNHIGLDCSQAKKKLIILPSSESMAELT